MVTITAQHSPRRAMRHRLVLFGVLSAGLIYTKEITAQVTRSINHLQKSLLMLSPNENNPVEKPKRFSEGNKLGITDKHLSEQISFISKVSSDIEKITQTISA